MIYIKGDIVFKMSINKELNLYMVNDYTYTSLGKRAVHVRSLKNHVEGIIETSEIQKFWLQVEDKVTIGLALGYIKKITFNDQLNEWQVCLKVGNNPSLQRYRLSECNTRLKFLDV